MNKGGGAEAEASNARQGIVKNLPRAQPLKSQQSEIFVNKVKLLRFVFRLFGRLLRRRLLGGFLLRSRVVLLGGSLFRCRLLGRLLFRSRFGVVRFLGSRLLRRGLLGGFFRRVRREVVVLLQEVEQLVDDDVVGDVLALRIVHVLFILFERLVRLFSASSALMFSSRMILSMTSWLLTVSAACAR